jgi:hypothetical protein
MYKILLIFVIIIPCLVHADGFDASNYYNEFSKYSLAPEDLMQMRHGFVVQKLRQIAAQSTHVELQEIGKSIEGRSINMLSFGTGEVRLLLWSQMHGDEPTATAALLAIYNLFSHNENDQLLKNIFNKLSIYSIIMLNPDGTQQFHRRNAQDLDINRDARLLQSPEGRALKRMREKIQPDYGFNLHDMRGREMVGDSKKLLSIALMAPPFDKENSDNPTRIRAKKLVAVVKNILDSFISNHMARYKADYMPRAFGDSMQKWGVSTILLESGLHTHEDPHFLVRLNFVALLGAFHAIASGEIEQADECIYDQIPLEGRQLFDLLIKNVLLYNGTNIAPFIADIGINIERELKNGQIVESGKITDLGDLSITDGIKVIEGHNLVLTPGFISRETSRNSVATFLKKGVTTLVTDEVNHSDTRKYLYSATQQQLQKIPIMAGRYKTAVNDVNLYTSVPAKHLEIDNLGLIKRDMQADLLIFSTTDSSELLFDNLTYVIKNGKIVYQK